MTVTVTKGTAQHCCRTCFFWKKVRDHNDNVVAEPTRPRGQHCIIINRYTKTDGDCQSHCDKEKSP